MRPRIQGVLPGFFGLLPGPLRSAAGAERSGGGRRQLYCTLCVCCAYGVMLFAVCHPARVWLNDIMPRWKTTRFLRALHVPGFDAVAQSSSPASGELRNTSNGVAQPPLSAHPLAPFAMTVVCRTDLKEGAGCCAICLDDVRARTTVMLNCCHRFHRDCLTNWPRTACSARYPLCNKPVARVEVGG